MKIIFHIGMGKTGTSSIQHALKASEATLRAQKAKYLGRWFGILDPAFNLPEGLGAFFNRPADALRESAGDFAALLERHHRKDGTETFIFSSEGIYGFAAKAKPFFEELNKRIPTAIIVYLRDPRSWLPSAYTQWGLRHKASHEPIPPYAAMAPKLIARYRVAEVWAENFGSILKARRYSKDIDIVSDFAEVIGVAIDKQPQRLLERSDQAEALLRGLFNDRFERDVRPEIFNRTILNTDKTQPKNISKAIEEWLDFSQTEAVVAGKRKIFERIRDKLGVDLLHASARPEPVLDKAAVKDRLIDYLVEIVFVQATQIKKIEKNLAALEDAQKNRPARAEEL